MNISEINFSTFAESIPQALDAINAAEILAKQSKVMVKPNAINSSPPPITTPAECTAAVVRYVQGCSDAEVIIAEGCGSSTMDTPEVFKSLGYCEMAAELGVELVDLNTAELVRLEDPECDVFKEFWMPACAMDSYIISVPVLKAHSLAEITGSMKNMMGLAPPSHYQQGGHWKKSAFHARIHESILDLNRYRSADLTVMDASIGMPEFHLGGPECDPPLNRIIAGFDAKEVDRRGAELLDLDWRGIGHLAN